MSRNVECRTRSRSCISVDIVETVIRDYFSSNNVEILDFHLKPFSEEKLGYLGVHQLLVVEARNCNDAKTKEIVTFFVKSLPPLCNSYQQKVCREESKFFHDVLPKLMENFNGEPWTARCYFSEDKLLVMEDLRSKGFKITEGQLNDYQMRSVIATLARFHASSLLLEDRLKRPLNEVYKNLFEEKMFTLNETWNLKWLSAGIEVAEAVARDLNLDPKYIKLGYKLSYERLNSRKKENCVLCHCDLWFNNVIFNETSCRLIDFQMVAYKPYIFDLLQLIHLNSSDTRRKSEREFIKLYHAVLDRNLREHGYGGQFINLNDIFRDLEDERISGLMCAVQFYPIILLNRKLSGEYTEDPDKLRIYMYSSRKDFVLKSMKLDANYREKIEGAVKELVEYMENRQVICT